MTDYKEILFSSGEAVAPNYVRPELRLLGDLCSLTETGSMSGAEDGMTDGMCMGANAVFNMC